jgi:hypothetical protein
MSGGRLTINVLACRPFDRLSANGFIQCFPNEHGEATPDNETRHARFPHLSPLVEQLAIRLNRQKKTAKSLVIPQAGEEANDSLREFHVKTRC